jgi:hypothetical protein
MQPINRVKPSKPFMSVDEAIAADRQYFEEHPEENEYIRDLAPGEFGTAEFPEIPEGFCYATIVSVFHRIKGKAVGRHRRLMAVCEGFPLQ